MRKKDKFDVCELLLIIVICMAHYYYEYLTFSLAILVVFITAHSLV